MKIETDAERLMSFIKIIEARELVMDMFVQACTVHNATPDALTQDSTRYDNHGSGTYEYVQEKLIEWGMIEKEECVR